MTAVAGAILLATAGPAQGAFPGANGKIAFDSERDCSVPFCSRTKLFTMNPDGSGQSRLLDEAALEPAWSPDGTKVAFTVDTNSFSNGPYIAVVNADGTGRRQLTPSFLLSNDGQPAWSPDGKKIAFTRFVHAGYSGIFELFVMDADGSNPTRLTYSAAGGAYSASEPDWSPDGKRIAFVRAIADPTFIVDYEVYVMNADGSGLVNVTNHPGPPPNDVDPSWSPDGTRIAFSSNREGSTDIYTIRPDGTDLSRVTGPDDGPDLQPAWSPDGTRIAYSHQQASFSGHQILTIGADGTGRAQLTDTGSSRNFHPDWQPLNRPPDCSGVHAIPASLRPNDKPFVTVTLEGATDPDANPVSVTIDAVTQDEPVGRTPDARLADVPSQVALRAARSNRGDGRVYRIAFTASDGKDQCSGVATVEVRRHRKRPAVDSAPPSFNSFRAQRGEESPPG